MRARTWAVPLAATLLAASAALSATADSGPTVAFTMKDPRITESSGLAASHLHPGVYWTHNDSGDGPYVYAIDSATGATVARITLRGVHARDCEAISIGPDGDIYLGDIGDNLNGAWPEVYLYRFPEPKTLRDQTVDATTYTVRYSDGPRNAESLMVEPRTGRVYIASKNEDRGHLYEGPEKLSPSGINVFRPIADVPWVTDGAFSPDGTRLVFRGYFMTSEYRWNGDRLGAEIGNPDVPVQQQGESVTFTPDGRALMTGSEGRDSQVYRVPLSGSELPDSVRASADPSGSAAPASGGAAAGSGGHRYPFFGVAFLAVAALLVVGTRRLRRRGR
ncbi:hypothetical protein [Streptomyces sp. ICBB 8177]|uniref:hypothetical protein n=1 Tax=Streptomyces sp. ICBB 8177 TaxID=563922 RepID=UPI000D6810E6|nr:hypothetical protein [Streptomyces sp. ICBB 8177]PWI45896.1 hypothetical protein CK485_01715 [Streptomyces sp. ICBB 8177]